MSLSAGEGRFFAKSKVEVVSEYYRDRRGSKAVDAMKPVKPKDKNYITSFSGRVYCSNSRGTGRTCDVRASVRAKSFPLSCLDIMKQD